MVLTEDMQYSVSFDGTWGRFEKIVLTRRLITCGAKFRQVSYT
jgi:hypothetical protein